MADFTRRLLEQWAVTHNLPLSLIHDADFAVNSSPPPSVERRRQGLVDRLRGSAYEGLMAEGGGQRRHS